jgi:prephenate dehydrogenase
VSQASVVVLALPGDQLREAMLEIAPALLPGALVTETSRWKAPAAQLAAEILDPAVHYVGGRPVLDQAGHGPEEATAAAFRNAVYCLTPGATASQEAIETLSTIVAAAGAQAYFLEPAEHDGLTAAGELLPPALLACLALTLTKDPAWVDVGKLAGDAVGRLSVLAEALEPAFWEEATAHSDALARWLDTSAATLIQLRDRLQSVPPKQLAGDWQATREALAAWRRDKRQLHEVSMPPASELKPNLFGAFGRGRKR